MIHYNTIYSYISIVLITMSLLSCKQENSNEMVYSKFAEIHSSTIYISKDKQQEFAVFVHPENDNGYITVHDVKANTDFILKRIASSDGITYKSEDDYTLWTKGSEFSWSKDGNLITNGHLKTAEIEIEKTEEISKFNSANYGNYVSSDYDKKDDGYDWTAVMVKPIDDFKSKITIRSRADKKSGTCTFDAIVNVMNSNTLKVTENNTIVLFSFNNQSVTISTDPETESDALMYFCSGGANLVGNYNKLQGDLDTIQMDKTGYFKSLTYNDIIYNIEEKEGLLSVHPIGLDFEYSDVYPVHGEIINVEIDDLNNDMFPEILVYTTSGTDKRGDVFGFSVNNEKSISKITVAKTSELKEANSGYYGHDEYAMVEGTFIQRFPIYENNQSTGKTRQIQYKLEDTETLLKHLVLDKVVEY